MPRNSSHRIGLVHYEATVHAWVLDLPGCIAGGASFGQVSAKLPLVLAEHIGWLKAHGEHVDEHDNWEIAEELDAADFAATGGEFCFQADRAALSRDELEPLIARMAHARDDLLTTVAGVLDAVLARRPRRRRSPRSTRGRRRCGRPATSWHKSCSSRRTIAGGCATAHRPASSSA